MKKKYGKGPHILRFYSSPPLSSRARLWTGRWESPRGKWSMSVSRPYRTGSRKLSAYEFFLDALADRKRRYGR